jgi:NAD+ kinase
MARNVTIMNAVGSASSATPAGRPRVILLSSAGERIEPIIQLLRPTIQHHAQIVLEDFTNADDLSQVEADLVLVFGGDGSILRSAQQMGHRQRPVLGINLGKLGFLADLSPDELPRVFPDVCAGRYQIIQHLMLACQVFGGSQLITERLCLNEVAVLGGPPYSLIEIDLYVDVKWVTTYSCDGLIISTPVGSTAHNLSAGGPILRKDLEAVVISPISPHTLTVRPVVDAANRQYEMRVRRRQRDVGGDQTAVVVDGIVVHQLGPDDRVVVTRATPTFQLIEVAGHGYYRTLREKLGWGGGIRNEPSS